MLPEETEYLSVAKSIVREHLAVLANKDFVKLRKLLNCDEVALKGAQTLIKQQNPRPGSDYAQLSTDHFIQHEVIVKKVKGIWIATLNDGVIPKLRINQAVCGYFEAQSRKLQPIFANANARSQMDD